MVFLINPCPLLLLVVVAFQHVQAEFLPSNQTDNNAETVEEPNQFPEKFTGQPGIRRTLQKRLPGRRICGKQLADLARMVCKGKYYEDTQTGMQINVNKEVTVLN